MLASVGGACSNTRAPPLLIPSPPALLLMSTRYKHWFLVKHLPNGKLRVWLGSPADLPPLWDTFIAIEHARKKIAPPEEELTQEEFDEWVQRACEETRGSIVVDRDGAPRGNSPIEES